MNWIGTIIGSLLGRSLLGGALGTIIGAVLGDKFLRFGSANDEDAGGWSGTGAGSRHRAQGTSGGSRRNAASPETAIRNEVILLGALAAMLAKLAKADGRVTQDEIAHVESIFDRLGLFGDKRSYVIDVFRKAKEDPHTIFDFAGNFANAQHNPEVRQFVYELLWDLAAADGVLSEEEDEILRRLPAHLHIWPNLYQYQRRRHVREEAPGGQSRGGADDHRRREAPQREASLDDCYALLGCSPDATDAEIRRAYREKAKKHHPDELQNQGLPPEFLERATEQMARINDAYARIKKARRISS